ncbi:MAG: hypothetical protein KC420_14630, partial [Myxococcales bacterium]|nr:hypothetical protein [Myxococcales bacterium]
MASLLFAAPAASALAEAPEPSSEAPAEKRERRENHAEAAPAAASVPHDAPLRERPSAEEELALHLRRGELEREIAALELLLDNVLPEDYALSELFDIDITDDEVVDTRRTQLQAELDAIF